MPNHVHGIIMIGDERRGMGTVPQGGETLLELTWLYVEANPANGKRITRTPPNTNHHLRFCIMATYPIGHVAFVIHNLSCSHTNCDNYHLLCDNYHLNRDYNVAEYS